LALGRWKLPGDDVHVGFLVDQLANLLPVPMPFALLADSRPHIPTLPS
jgi:hypothetical protein